jgi:predicted molibdopterin-dependent oxidoreductase YjgC
MKPVLPEFGDSKPAWRAFAELSLRLDPKTPFFNARDVMAQIAQTHPSFAAATYAELEEEGTVLAP